MEWISDKINSRINTSVQGIALNTYGSEKFDPEAEGRSIVATLTEADRNKKIRDLLAFQDQIGLVLRQNVRENYAVFLDANQEIHKIGSEMTDIKHLAEETLDLISNARVHCESATFLKEKSDEFLSDNLITKLMNEYDERHGSESNDLKNLPPWLTKSKDSIETLIIEKQFPQAVSLITKTKKHIKKISNGVDEETQRQLDEIYERMNNKANEVAAAIKDSLNRLPNSALWGTAEYHRRLKLLVALGHLDLAAEGFSMSQSHVIKKCLRSIEASGDSLTYTKLLSQSFFGHLERACKVYLTLFVLDSGERRLGDITAPGDEEDDEEEGDEEEGDSGRFTFGMNRKGGSEWDRTQGQGWSVKSTRSAGGGAGVGSGKHVRHGSTASVRLGHRVLEAKHMSANLLTWMSQRLEDYLVVLLAQVRFAVSERLSALLEKLRRTFYRLDKETALSVLKGVLSAASSPGNLQCARYCCVAALQDSEAPLAFARKCMSVALQKSVVLDALDLPGSITLAGLMVGDVSSLIKKISDTLAEEIAFQVENETWDTIGAPTPLLRVHLCVPGQNHDVAALEQKELDGQAAVTDITGSYLWVQSLLTLLLEDFVNLLRPQRGDHGDQVDTELWDGIIEIEPDLVACFMKLLIKYVKCVEAATSPPVDNPPGRRVDGEGHREKVSEGRPTSRLSSGGGNAVTSVSKQLGLVTTVKAIAEHLLPSVCVVFGIEASELQSYSTGARVNVNPLPLKIFHTNQKRSFCENGMEISKAALSVLMAAVNKLRKR